MAKARVDWKTAAAEEIWHRAMYYARLFIVQERESMPYDDTLAIADRATHEIEEIIQMKIPACSEEAKQAEDRARMPNTTKGESDGVAMG